MLLDHFNSNFHTLRTKAEVIVYPVQWVVGAPVHMLYWLADSVETRQYLVMDNAKLRAHQLLLNAKINELLTINKQSLQLKKLLKSHSYTTGKIIVAHLLAVDLNPARDQIVVDKGINAHVYVTQPVVDGYGVVGQVVATNALASRIMLLTDVHSDIPVKDLRSGVRAIAEGMGVDGTLHLLHVTSTADIKVGDEMVTSGLGLHFEVGYPVANVVKVHPMGENSHFVEIDLIPLAHINRAEQVLMVWPNYQNLKESVNHLLLAEKQTDENSHVQTN